MFFRINVFYFITLILLQGHQSKARGPVCLQCDQVSQPSDCRNIKRCGDQDLCSMRKYVTNNGHMWFDVGCSSSQRCSPITSILGKRNDDDGLLPISSSKLGRNGKHNIKTNYVRSAGDTIVCEKCCSGDICNAGSLCGTVGFLHEMVCFRCASTNEDGCSTIELCDQNEKCFIEKVINSSTSQNVWKTGCRHKDMCKQLQSNPETECLSSCCSSDLCNRKCTINNADAKCVDMSQTCTNETFQSFVCSTKELQAVCPRSCGLCHCSQNPCTHGTCTSTRQGYKCTCDAGYTGSICDRVIEHCSPNPCVHGICNNSPQGFSCRCSSGYKGSTCTVIEHCSANPCVHGICNNNPQGYSCSCSSGYKGSTCTVIDHCSPNPCVHGICNNNPQGYNCRCSSGYKGSTCTDMNLIDHCSPNPCVHGICSNNPQGYNCRCSSGYKGSTCTDMDPCMSAPCIHGTCHTSHNGYTCTCDNGYTGSTCDSETGLFYPYHKLWKWTDCSDPATRAITVSRFDLSPKPLRIPGNISSAYDITIHRWIGQNSHLRLNVTMEKKLIGNWHFVPCYKHVGTCVYNDLCDFYGTIYNRTCPQEIIDLGLTCGCPINPVHLVRSHLSAVGSSYSDFWQMDPILDILSGQFEIKVIPSAFGHLIAGDFRVRIELLEHNKTVGCLAVELSISIPCHGFLCGG